jgi:WS/DGAT/MGAT family acyltransferase
VAGLFSQRLDRSRPLWQIDVVGPLADGGVAVVWRLHHAIADGYTFVRLLEAVLWDTAAPDPAHRSATTSQPAVAAPLPHQRHLRRNVSGFAEREFARSRRTSPFDGPLTAQRDVAFASLRLPALHDAARANGATVNDALLSVVAGGLRRWIERHAGPLGDVRARIPVSLHDPGDGPGNRDSYFGVDLPVHEADPALRLAAISAETALRKSEHDADSMDALLRELSRVSPRLAAACERVQDSPRCFALSVSNVPGPRRTVSVLRTPVASMHSLAEIGERHALRVAAISLAEGLHVGLCADPTIVDGLGPLADDIAAEARFLTEPFRG